MFLRRDTIEYVIGDKVSIVDRRKPPPPPSSARLERHQTALRNTRFSSQTPRSDSAGLRGVLEREIEILELVTL
jgi:hypothetical protein